MHSCVKHGMLPACKSCISKWISRQILFGPPRARRTSTTGMDSIPMHSCDGITCYLSFYCMSAAAAYIISNSYSVEASVLIQHALPLQILHNMLERLLKAQGAFRPGQGSSCSARPETNSRCNPAGCGQSGPAAGYAELCSRTSAGRLQCYCLLSCTDSSLGQTTSCCRPVGGCCALQTIHGWTRRKSH